MEWKIFNCFASLAARSAANNRCAREYLFAISTPNKLAAAYLAQTSQIHPRQTCVQYLSQCNEYFQLLLGALEEVCCLVSLGSQAGRLTEVSLSHNQELHSSIYTQDGR